ncbi:Eco57I restriction-modification methylase domain-containing protein [Pedobacter xixiisoli]|uniref:Adenine-specific DNA methylase, N12 class n=1 Tax=Pedobacter xixiisoli TaxID=1476464 RepID=A0A286A723_9SPHI|nr:helicase-related protein [Pedobacter xixiisoli]SOD17687.1 Adenine-specific DNA methylase, N12 class [Pedobacter xixiisoli]
MAYNSLHKLRANILAIKIALKWSVERNTLSILELSKLRAYSGFGGIKAILHPEAPLEQWEKQGISKADRAMYEEIMDLHQTLRKHFGDQQYKQVISSLRNSVLTSFYTPEVIPNTFYSVLETIGIKPQRIYEPSAGVGIFVEEAFKAFPDIKHVSAVEKDQLTGLILTAVNSAHGDKVTTQIRGLEETPKTEDGQFDLVVSNIPFGNFKVYDNTFAPSGITSKIHNYFFAKGLEKLSEGGILCYLTTDGFLNSPSNRDAREYVFKSADFLAVAAMPDNLMKDTGGTEAPSHLLIVQRRDDKTVLSAAEKELLETVVRTNEFGEYHVNEYLHKRPELLVGDKISEDRNQYGQPHQRIWQETKLEEVGKRLRGILTEGLDLYFVKARYPKHHTQEIREIATVTKVLTYAPMPEEAVKEQFAVQLGLFDIAPVEILDKAKAYLTEQDKIEIRKDSARIVCTISTTDRPAHEVIVMIVAKPTKSEQYRYKIFSNVQEVTTSNKWYQGTEIRKHIEQVSDRLLQFNHQYIYKGDQLLTDAFVLHHNAVIGVDIVKSYYREGTLVVENDKIGQLVKLDQVAGKAEFKQLPIQTNLQFYKSYCQLRDKYMHLSQMEASAEPVPDILRMELDSHYEEFVSKFGSLNSRENRRRILEDRGCGLIVLASLERRAGDQFVKADILTTSTVKKEETFVTDQPALALAHCLNKVGKVELQIIAAALDVDSETAIVKLGDLIYLNPKTNNWETADQFLSGNVVRKLHDTIAAIKDDAANVQYKRSLEALERSQPEKIPFELLDFNLGERWIPVTFYKEFASQLFETECQIAFFSSIDTFKVKAKRNTKVDNEFAVIPKSGRKMYGYTLLEHALENTAPNFTIEETGIGGSTIRRPDNDAIQLAYQKIENIRERFVVWLNELPPEKKVELETIYNGKFNCYKLRENDGSHLTFPGLDLQALGINDLYSSQKNAVWRIIQDRGALIDHEVGLGKTLTMIVASYEMKRLGICNKPVILGLQSNVGQIAEAYRTAYPTANIIAPDENDFSPRNRVRLLHEIKNNNWDCVILTHEQFEKIEQAEEIQQQIFRDLLYNVEKDLDTLEDLGEEISKEMRTGLEVKKNNLAVKLKTVQDRMANRKDSGITFQNIGIDHLFVDESHKFKNLAFTTRHRNVAGLGNSEGSQRAMNMLFAVRTLQQKFDQDLCATFLSGTPISNSLTELYLIFYYLRPRELEAQGIENFDGWAAVYAKKTSDFEFNVANEIVVKERFRFFIKVPELAMFYNEIADYKTADHIRLDKPVIEETLVNIKPTDEQVEFIDRLMKFAKSGNAEYLGRAKLSSKEDKARMLIATNYAKKLAVDMRLISQSRYFDHPNNKISVCAKKIAQIHSDTKEYKGTQLVFCDMGTPGTDGFNIYQALLSKLVNEYGIPKESIAFVHNYKRSQKNELFTKVNNGEIRVLLGSTEKLGTGNNSQQRIVAIHHLDTPWKPSEFEQRNGRGARQGNWVAKQFRDNKVEVFVYATERSLDAYKFNLLRNKQFFISQMKSNQLQVRTIDEGAMDEKSGMNFAEYLAILSGDTSLMEKAKLEKKIAALESLKKIHYNEHSRNRSQIENKTLKLASSAKMIVRLKIDRDHYQSVLKLSKDGIKENPIRLIGIKSNDSEALGNHIIDVYNSWLPKDLNDSQRIGSLYGYDLHIERRAYDDKNMLFAQRNPNGIKYYYNNGEPNILNPKLAARYFLNAIARVDQVLEKYENDGVTLKKEIADLNALNSLEFTREKDLQEFKKALKELEKEIREKIQSGPSNEDTPIEEVTIADGVCLPTTTSDILKEGKVVKLQPDRGEEKMYAQIRRNTRTKFRR